MSINKDNSPPRKLKALLVILFLSVLIIGYFVERVKSVGVGNKNIEQDYLIVTQGNSLMPMASTFYFKPHVLATMAKKSSIREEIVEEMTMCESGGNDLALNACDKDGTPSYGRLQFKPETLRSYVLKYGFFGIEDVNTWTSGDLLAYTWDGELQERIFRKMLDDEDVVWETEFPDCFKKHKQLFLAYWAN